MSSDKTEITHEFFSRSYSSMQYDRISQQQLSFLLIFCSFMSVAYSVLNKFLAALFLKTASNALSGYKL